MVEGQRQQTAQGKTEEIDSGDGASHVDKSVEKQKPYKLKIAASIAASQKKMTMLEEDQHDSSERLH